MKPHPIHETDVQINRIHSSAVCEEIGERLFAALGSPSGELTPPLLALIKGLAKEDNLRDEPSKTRGDFNA
jgi:hypothetical protein